MNTAQAILHANTPSVSCVDARGLALRTIEYLRRTTRDDATRLVTHQTVSVGGRIASQQDPRLWQMANDGETDVPPNQASWHSLSGSAVRTQSVDAGWRLSLFDDAGLPRHQWDARGTHERAEHAPLGRLSAVFEQTTGETTERCAERLTYGGPEGASSNACGQRTRHDDPAGTLTFASFSLDGQPLAETRRFLLEADAPDWPPSVPERDALLETANWTTAWAYDALGTTLRQTDARGNVSTQTLTLSGELASVALQLAGDASEQIVVRDLVYDATGRLCQQLAGNGVLSKRVYSEADGRLVSLHSRKADGTGLQALVYDYDPAGNVVRVEDMNVEARFHRHRRTDGVITYAYDTLSRLASATGRESDRPSHGPGLPDPGDETQLMPYVREYEYDDGDNLTKMHHTGARSFTSTMDVAPRSNRALQRIEDTAPPDFDASFDANGNLQTLAPGQAMQWTTRNQLCRVTQITRTSDTPGTANEDDDERYVYDGGGQRVRKITRRLAQRVTHTAEVRYLPGLEHRTDTATGTTLDVVSISGGMTAVRLLHWESDAPEGIDNDSLRYRLDDHLGSGVCEVDADANVTSREGFYPFGGTAWQASRHAVEVKYRVLRYAGRERDATGLYYYGFRYLAPWLHRWINPDPAGDIDGLNVFALVSNNPITMTDREGLSGEAFSGAQVAAYMLAAFLVGVIATVAFFRSKGKARDNDSPKRPSPDMPNAASSAGESGASGQQSRVNALASTHQSGIVDTPPSRRKRLDSESSLSQFERDNLRGSIRSIASQSSIGSHSSLQSTDLSIGFETDTSSRSAMSGHSYRKAAAAAAGAAPASKKRPRPSQPTPIPEEQDRPKTPPGSLWHIVESPKFIKQRSPKKKDKTPETAQKNIEAIMKKLLTGDTPGKRENVKGIIPGHDSFYSEDVIGLTNKGRGVQRLIYTRDHASKQVLVHGIGDYHKERGGMKPPKWW